MSRTNQRWLLCSLTFAVVLLLVVAAESDANDIRWGKSSGGTFSSTANWAGGVVPDGNDYAHFGLSGGMFGSDYTVSFTTSATNLGLVVEDDFVTYDLNSQVYTTTQFDAVTVGTVPHNFFSPGAGALTVIDGILSVPFQSEFAVGAVANGTGALTVSTAGLIIGDPSLEIGVAGTGTLTIQNNGDILTDRTHIGFNAGVTGTATVTGAGSSLTAVEVFVGSSGTGTLNINSSGRVDVGTDAWVGNLAGSNGTANIDGAGSEWNISGGLTVGNEANGTVNVTGGGQVTSDGSKIAFLSPSGSHGAVTVDGPNSRWTNTNALSIGGDGSGAAVGELRISAGGVVQNTRGELDTGSVTVEGSGSQWVNSDTLTIGYKGVGTLTVNGGAVSSGSVLTIGDGSSLASGTMNVTNGGSVSSAAASIGKLSGSTGTVTVAGAGSTWTISGRLGVGVDATAGTEGGTGVVRIQTGGTVNVTQEIVVGDSVPGSMDQLFLEGGTLSTPEIDFLAAFKPFFWTSGTLHVGTYHGNIIVPNGGGLAPGNSAGSTLILGDYSQGAPDAALEIEIGGTASGSQYDVVNVSGNVFLGGNLHLAMLNGFMPGPANTFAILQATGNFSGAFANAANGQRLLTNDGLGSFIVNYGPGSAFSQKQVVLSGFLAAAIPGDYNQNGVVDAADYVVWRNGGSPDSTQAGYNLWKANFGKTSGSGSAMNGFGAAVPEPASFVLLMTALTFAIPKHRRTTGNLRARS